MRSLTYKCLEMDARAEMWWQRLNQLMKERGWGPSDLAEHSGVRVENVKKYSQGKVENPRGNIMEKLARALNVSEADLKYGSQTHASRVEVLQRGGPLSEVEVIGEIRAGHWMEAQEQEQFERYTIPVVAPGPSWFALKVIGPSMTEAGFADGSFAVCEPLSHRKPIAADEDYVAVERIRPDGLREVTLKQYMILDDGQVELWPRSKDPRYQTPLPFDDGPHGTEVRIIGIVRGRYEEV